MLAPYVKNCTAIFTELAEVPKIFLSPLPRWHTMGCCDDPDHAPNMDNPNFSRTIISGAERQRKVIQDQMIANAVRNFKVLDPL
jgi:hypothetical protein